jgi:hypothetical protein
MIYKFRIISSENEDFIREVAINSHSTFYDLHIFLVDDCFMSSINLQNVRCSWSFLKSEMENSPIPNASEKKEHLPSSWTVQ